MDPTNKDFILGSQKEHFNIEDNIITGINQDLLTQLEKCTYSGPLDISFPGCQEITSIKAQAFKNTYLKHICSINLSRMNQLEYIHERAFQHVGFMNEHFSEINLSCPQLKTIDKQTFENVGRNSNYVKIIFGRSQLTNINFAAFRNVGSPQSKKLVEQNTTQEELTLDFSGTFIIAIAAQAFMNYNKYTKSKLANIIFPSTEFNEFQKCTFKNAFSNCDKVMLKLTTKRTYTINEECFAGMKIHLDLSNTDDELIAIKHKAIDAKYLNDNSAKIIIPKDNIHLHLIIGYPILQFLCLQENGQLEDQEDEYDKNLCGPLKGYTKEQLQAEISKAEQELKQNIQLIEEEAKQYLQKVKAIQQLRQSIRAKKQVVQMQQQFIEEQEERIKSLMHSLGYFDDIELAKRLQ